MDKEGKENKNEKGKRRKEGELYVNRLSFMHEFSERKNDIHSFLIKTYPHILS
jgi:hypothetical protein